MHLEDRVLYAILRAVFSSQNLRVDIVPVRTRKLVITQDMLESCNWLS